MELLDERTIPIVAYAHDSLTDLENLPVKVGGFRLSEDR